MAMLAVHMAMGDFFWNSGANIGNFQFEVQHHASPGVVAIQIDRVALDLHHGENLLFTFVVNTFERSAQLDPRGEAAFGNGLLQIFVANAKGLFGLQCQGGLIALGLAIERGFNGCQGIAIASMQIGHGFFGVVQHFALGIADLVAKGDDSVFVNVHGVGLEGVEKVQVLIFADLM